MAFAIILGIILFLIMEHPVALWLIFIPLALIFIISSVQLFTNRRGAMGNIVTIMVTFVLMIGALVVVVGTDSSAHEEMGTEEGLMEIGTEEESEETLITSDDTQEISEETSRKCEPGKMFSFQFQGSTAMSYVKPYCEHPGHIYISTSFRGTPNDLSYLEAIKANSDSDEIVGGEYYTVTATVALGDHDYIKTRIRCQIESEDILVGFSVEFREGFEEAVGALKKGDTVAFRGRYYDEGCGFTDAELIIE